MTDLVQIISLGVSALLLLLVIELVRRRILVEEYSFVWIVCASSLLLLSAFRNILHTVAHWLGIYYPPSVLLLVVLFFGFIGSLLFSIVISTQRAQIHRLFEDTAILAAELRDLKRSPPVARKDEPPHHVTESSSSQS